MNNKIIKICDECESQYFADSSKMANLCPECAALLYGYENCQHQFENGRCLYCYWNGNSSPFFKSALKPKSRITNG